MKGLNVYLSVDRFERLNACLTAVRFERLNFFTIDQTLKLIKPIKLDKYARGLYCLTIF